MLNKRKSKRTAQDLEYILTALSKIPFLAKILATIHDQKVLHSIAKETQLKESKAGEVIYKEGNSIKYNDAKMFRKNEHAPLSATRRLSSADAS